MKAPDLRPLGVGEVLDVAIKLYLRNAGTLIATVSVVVIPLAILSILVLLSSLPDFATIANDQVLLPTEDDVRRFVVSSVLVGLLQGLGTLVATGAAFKALGDAYLGTKPNVGSSLGFAGRRILPLIWLNILIVIVIAGGFIALFIPGIYIAVALIVVVPARLLEDLKGLKALRRSRDLVKGRWWPTFGVVLLGVFLIPAFLGFLISLVVSAVSLTGVNSPSTFFVVNGIGDAISALLTTPLQAAIITVLYFDLRVRKEGFDLELLARNLGEPEPFGAAPTSGPPLPTPGPQAPPGSQGPLGPPPPPPPPPPRSYPPGG
ncbi:MAG: hypothetical protein ABR505_09765 [Actinomycetota bacterium]